MADICYLTILSFIIGFILARLIDNIFKKIPKNEQNEKTLTESIIKVLVLLSVTSIFIYISRNIIELVPSPFQGYYGLNHLILKEIKNVPILQFSILYYQTQLHKELSFILKNIS
jgi:hypothetical protein